MEILIPFGSINDAKTMSLALIYSTVGNADGQPKTPFIVWKNKADRAYIYISDLAQVLTIHPDKKTRIIRGAYQPLIDSGDINAGDVSLLSGLDSDLPVSHTVGELIVNDLAVKYKTPAQLLAIGYRPVPTFTEVTTTPPILTEVEYQLKKIQLGNNINDYAAALIGAKNNELNKTSDDIQAVMSAFGPIQSVLAVGGLGTARLIIQSIKAGFPDYQNAFDYALNELENFELIYGSIQ